MIEMFGLVWFGFLSLIFFWSFVISVGDWKKAIRGQAALKDLHGL